MTGALARRLGLRDAVVVGLGAMLGAGVFSAFAPAAEAAGRGLLLGLGLAALVALCNATSSAQLAAAHPRAGGTYLYGRELLGPWWGFVAGWGFVVGKTASCAAMALTVAAHTLPSSWQRPGAAAVVVALVLVDRAGVRRTAAVTAVTVALVLLVLAGVVVAGSSSPAPSPAPGPPVTAYGVLQSAGLLFFAFAGYARIATLGEEVRDPERTVPRAVLIALGTVVVVYTLVATAALRALGAEGLADQDAPLVAVVEAAGWSWGGPVVRLGAAAAALGALLGLLAGVGRTTLAMAREGDLPRALAAVDPVRRVPARAVAVVGCVVVALVLLTDLRGAIGFSSFGVLVYYLVANLSAFAQPAHQRRVPRPLQVLGAAGCVLLAATLPATSVVAGAVVLAVGVAGRLLVRAGARPVDPGVRQARDEGPL